MNIVLPGKAAGFAARQRQQAEKQREQLGIEARSWYRITNAADSDEAEVMLYDEIGGWFGSTADELIAELKGITAPRMRVRINSPGGSVFEGIAIANALRAHPANVTVQVDAVAASIASVIAMAGDRIEMAPNSMMMIHDASGLCMGDASDMEEMAELLDLISDNIADAYAQRAGGTREQWRERMKAETWYLPEDAVDNGLADEALAAPKAGTPSEAPAEEEPDMARPFDLAAYGYAGPKQPEAPKPAAPAAAEQGVTLTFNLGDTVDEQVIETIRKMVARRDPAPDVAATPSEQPAEPATELRGEPGPELVALTDAQPETDPATDEPEDPWAAMVAHLTKDEPDAWSVLVSNLTTTASSSAATEA
ncbi:head maturation protease, ClpP-related [Streptomyces chartreusis]|uniref:head maturation protease, ClpP-related n=1 Tax=Streptomyces chartreusis TaxID=1969 RepID=UPI0037F8AF84